MRVNRYGLLGLAAVVHGLIALGMSLVLAGGFFTRKRYWHRLPALVALCAFVLFTLAALVAGLFPTERWVWILGAIYGLSIASVALIASWISQERHRERAMPSGGPFDIPEIED